MEGNGVIEMSNLPQVMEHSPLTLRDVREHINLVQTIMKDVMTEGEHYGIIPGCQKPSLYKAGAEKLSMVFRLCPSFESKRTTYPGDHIEYEVKCILRNLSGQVLGEGVGCCSTLESKYRYRNGARKCPNCHKETIIKGKEEYGGGWVCFAKKGGCGHKYPDNAPEIVGQQLGQIENPDPADQYNTIFKMAKKRAHVDAIITVTAASDIFSQDVEDLPLEPVNVTPVKPEPKKPTPAPRTVNSGGEIIDTHTGEVLGNVNAPKKEGPYVYALPVEIKGVNMDKLREQIKAKFGGDSYDPDKKTWNLPRKLTNNAIDFDQYLIAVTPAQEVFGNDDINI